MYYTMRELMLPCEWHHGTFQFIRSKKSLQQERGRQVALGHWLLWHPYSPIKYYWDCMQLIVSYILFLYIPLQVFYHCPNPYDPIILFYDGLAFLDIFSKFITGYCHEDGKKVTLERKEIARLYLKGMFIFDFLAALPLQCIKIFDDCKYSTHTMWFVFKLFSLMSMRKQWQNFYKQMGLSYVASVGITVFMRGVLFFHWMTYLLYQIPSFCAHYYKDNLDSISWFKRLHVTDSASTTVFQKYMSNLYLICGLCNGSSHYSPMADFLIPEMLVNSAMGIVGLMFLTYSFATLLRLAIYGRFEVLLYNGRLKELTDYMVFKGLPKTLQRKIQLFINYKFYEHYFNEQAIMNTVNEQIKQDINMHCCKKLVMNVPIFQDMPIALINTIVFSLTQALYMPGETIIKCDQSGQSIYLIYSGTVAVINSTGREVAHLRDGSYFGEAALLDPGVLRTVTIIALEITEMYKLSTKDFQTCLQPYPHLKRRLEESSTKHKRKGRRRE
ncbi:potassium/sodium hyperpolarization-activated cyclic nucleotide-gated channel 1-like [Ostrinia nubilalis]|uniref:potassium/sodium hyperpolarization-activated cyclic nucleotide-gated channel 1-like n=1 Tax=Ostrinia nubilalis TaxID=29057 RepID=UPI003082427E